MTDMTLRGTAASREARRLTWQQKVLLLGAVVVRS
jgi:hypothetical protein